MAGLALETARAASVSLPPIGPWWQSAPRSGPGSGARRARARSSANQFNGTGMVEPAATGWINVKGNGWLIQGNTGVNSDKTGYQVHQVYPGWGIGNVFTGNRAHVNGPGYGIYVQSKRLQTVVSCDNAVTAAGEGFSTLPCSSA